MNNISSRIKQFIDYKDVSVRQFEQKIGASNGLIANSLKKGTDIQSKWVSIIIETHPEINPTWILTGRGEMLLNAPVEGLKAAISEVVIKKQSKGVPLIPVEAMAGYASGDVQVHEYEISDTIHVPDFEQKGVKYFIRVSGSSMLPKYNNGDVLACRPITDTSFFQWGKVYVLDTEQGPLVKRLFPDPKSDECLVCKSDNEAYPPFSIPKTSIRSVAIAIGVIRLE